MGTIFSGITAQYRYQRSRWIVKGEVGVLGRFHDYLNDYNYSRADLVQPFSAPIIRGQIGVRFWNIFVAGLALSAVPPTQLGETWWFYDEDILDHDPSYSEIRASRVGLQPFVGLSFPGRGPKQR
ncbi:MAG: hypothetical protein AAF399_11645 [Bacteroidota bacterium]